MILNDLPWKQTEIFLFFSFVVFKLAPDYCILESFLDYEGYSTSSMIVLASIVDIMVI